MPFLPLLAAIFQAASSALDKKILSIPGMNFKAYTGASFPIGFVFLLLIFALLWPPLTADLFSGELLLYLLLSIAMSIAANLFYYRALADDKLQEMQTLSLISGIPVVIVSGLLFTDERNPALIIPALIATTAIVWSHWEHRHFRIAPKSLPFLFWAIVMAPLAAAISKILLMHWHPVSFELVRTGAVALAIGPFFWKEEKLITKNSLRWLILTNILTTTAWLLFFTSYQQFGIVYTMLLFSVEPLLVYIAAVVLLKESFEWKKFSAFLIVLASIGVAQLLSG